MSSKPHRLIFGGKSYEYTTLGTIPEILALVKSFALERGITIQVATKMLIEAGYLTFKRWKIEDILTPESEIAEEKEKYDAEGS